MPAQLSPTLLTGADRKRACMSEGGPVSGGRAEMGATKAALYSKAAREWWILSHPVFQRGRPSPRRLEQLVQGLCKQLPEPLNLESLSSRARSLSQRSLRIWKLRVRGLRSPGRHGQSTQPGMPHPYARMPSRVTGDLHGGLKGPQ